MSGLSISAELREGLQRVCWQIRNPGHDPALADELVALLAALGDDPHAPERNAMIERRTRDLIAEANAFVTHTFDASTAPASEAARIIVELAEALEFDWLNRICGKGPTR